MICSELRMGMVHPFWLSLISCWPSFPSTISLWIDWGWEEGYYSEVFILWGGSQLVLVGGEQLSPALWGASGLYPTSLLFQIHMKLLGMIICFVHIGQGMIDMQIKSSKTSLLLAVQVKESSFFPSVLTLRIWMARTDCVLTLPRLSRERFSDLQIWKLEAFHLSDLMWNMVILLNSQFLLEEQVTAIRYTTVPCVLVEFIPEPKVPAHSHSCLSYFPIGPLEYILYEVLGITWHKH